MGRKARVPCSKRNCGLPLLHALGCRRGSAGTATGWVDPAEWIVADVAALVARAGATPTATAQGLTRPWHVNDPLGLAPRVAVSGFLARPGELVCPDDR
jgi:hypothetical protein